MKNRLNNKGFTLIELIMFIVVGAIFIPVSLIAFTSVMSNYSRPDYYVKARFYAEERMSIITSRDYDEIKNNDLCSEQIDAGDGYKMECTITSINPVDLSTTLESFDDYKRIRVTVKYDGLLGDYVISTIVTRRP